MFAEECNVNRIPNVLTIAGSDPSGGAGIQADLKTFAAYQVFGCAVITALTCQNSLTVSNVHLPPPEFVREQLQTLLADVNISSIKVGMVATASIAETVATVLADWKLRNPGSIVMDPVMISKSGCRLVDDTAAEAIKRHLIPLADIITPNLHEAGALLSREVPSDKEAMSAAARELLGLGCQAVVVKGGAAENLPALDVYVDHRQLVLLEGDRLASRHNHGTGCTFSAGIAAGQALGLTKLEATRRAKAFVAAAMAAAARRVRVGNGHQPLHHGYAMAADE